MTKKELKTIEELLFKVYDKGLQQEDCNLTEFAKKIDEAINYSQCCKSDSEQFFLFYKELQKFGRLYNDNLSEDIMKRECDWFVKNK